MEKYVLRFSINSGLLITSVATMFTGLLIQINYHMGNHGNVAKTNSVMRMNYETWSDLHKITIVMLSVLMIFHIYRHWKWYKVVMQKKLFPKNSQVIILSILFILVSLTGFIPWFIYLSDGDLMVRKIFIEVHDKLAIFFSVYLMLHILKRIRWFYYDFNQNRRK